MSGKRRDWLEPEWRFWAKVKITDSCWIWTAAKTSAGYGEFWPGPHRGSPMIYSHRYSYQLLVGPIPGGLDMDHLCRNPICCNPAHLEPVTHHENMLRGNTGKNTRDKTHCPQGHPYSEENTRVYHGRRSCIACGKASQKRRYAEKGDEIRKQRMEYYYRIRSGRLG